MKTIYLPLILVLLVFTACSNDSQEAEVTIEEAGEPARTIRITVEGKKDVVIEDPYIEEIEALSAEYLLRRNDFIKNRKAMTPEERKAYSAYSTETGEYVRKLQNARKDFIREQMKTHDGINVTAEIEGANQAIGETRDYLKGIQEAQ